MRDQIHETPDMILNPYRFGAQTFQGFGNSSIDDIHASGGSDATLDNIFDGGATVACWVKIASDGGGDTGRIWDKRASTNSGWFLLTLNESGGFVDLRFSLDFTTTDHRVVTSVSISLNVWHHVAVSYDSSSSSNNAVMYIDGVKLTVGSGLTEELVASGTALDDGVADFLLGHNGLLAENARPFDGLMCDVRVYGTVISDAQVLNIAGGVHEATNLVSWWTLEDDDYTDSVGSNDLTKVTGTLSSDGPAD